MKPETVGHRLRPPLDRSMIPTPVCPAFRSVRSLKPEIVKACEDVAFKIAFTNGPVSKIPNNRRLASLALVDNYDATDALWTYYASSPKHKSTPESATRQISPKCI